MPFQYLIAMFIFLQIEKKSITRNTTDGNYEQFGAFLSIFFIDRQTYKYQMIIPPIPFRNPFCYSIIYQEYCIVKHRLVKLPVMAKDDFISRCIILYLTKSQFGALRLLQIFCYCI